MTRLVALQLNLRLPRVTSVRVSDITTVLNKHDLHSPLITALAQLCYG